MNAKTRPYENLKINQKFTGGKIYRRLPENHWPCSIGVFTAGILGVILEVAILDVKSGFAGEFETAFKMASAIIASMPGYRSHELQRCLETPNRYILLVRWQTLEDHTIGFRQSPEYQQWRSLLHHFYDPFPLVEHYEMI